MKDYCWGDGALGRLYSYITSSRGREGWGREGEREGERGGEREREGGREGSKQRHWRDTPGRLRSDGGDGVTRGSLLPLGPVNCRMKNLWSETRAQVGGLAVS